MQLPLAVSGWGFKEEFTPAVKIEKMEDDGEPMEPAVEGNFCNYDKTCFLFLGSVVFTVLIFRNKEKLKGSSI